MLYLPLGKGKTLLVLTMLRHRKLLELPAREVAERSLATLQKAADASRQGGAVKSPHSLPGAGAEPTSPMERFGGRTVGSIPSTGAAAIVFVPYITATDTWVQETAKFAPELKCCALIGSSVENIETIKTTDYDLYVMCYQSAVAMVSQLVSIKGKGKWALDPLLISSFDKFDTLICDEVQKVKNPNSLTFQLCRTIAGQAKYVYGLTGTPFGLDLQDLWSQFYLVDFGDTLGSTLGFYRAVFFSIKRKFWGGVEFKFKKRLMPHLQKMIKNRSIRYSLDELSDMPEKQYCHRYLTLPHGIKGYVDKAKLELKDAVSGRQHELAGNSYIQLRQLSSGFLTLKDNQTKIKVKFDDNPKLDVLCELIEGASECKFVVFHEFVFTNELISNRLKELKIGHARVWGGQRDQLGQLRKFREDPECRVLVINSKSGSASLNLQFASYLVFFEQPTSAIDRQQAEGRVWRSGQTRCVMIYDLFVNGTYDRRQHDANKNGENLLQLLLDGKEEV